MVSACYRFVSKNAAPLTHGAVVGYYIAPGIVKLFVGDSRVSVGFQTAHGIRCLAAAIYCYRLLVYKDLHLL